MKEKTVQKNQISKTCINHQQITKEKANKKYQLLKHNDTQINNQRIALFQMNQNEIFQNEKRRSERLKRKNNQGLDYNYKVETIGPFNYEHTTLRDVVTNVPEKKLLFYMFSFYVPITKLAYDNSMVKKRQVWNQKGSIYSSYSDIVAILIHSSIYVPLRNCPENILGIMVKLKYCTSTNEPCEMKRKNNLRSRYSKKLKGYAIKICSFEKISDLSDLPKSFVNFSSPKLPEGNICKKKRKFEEFKSLNKDVESNLSQLRNLGEKVNFQNQVNDDSKKRKYQEMKKMGNSHEVRTAKKEKAGGVIVEVNEEVMKQKKTKRKQEKERKNEQEIKRDLVARIENQFENNHPHKQDYCIFQKEEKKGPLIFEQKKIKIEKVQMISKKFKTNNQPENTLAFPKQQLQKKISNTKFPKNSNFVYAFKNINSYLPESTINEKQKPKQEFNDLFLPLHQNYLKTSELHMDKFLNEVLYIFTDNKVYELLMGKQKKFNLNYIHKKSVIEQINQFSQAKSELKIPIPLNSDYIITLLQNIECTQIFWQHNKLYIDCFNLEPHNHIWLAKTNDNVL
ncbi:hypothetical protein M0812_23104 [Anaeramoeba flamelloides]|uniref:Uncharacterized protein n=1 Tax=Anaeramoeba flamelloides TaxID=1746091 RepID=A0AAV7YRM4_9EUKA|nr:hypothetical protein M0812_23104 [Anaeramoeba flamelloides]